MPARPNPPGESRVHPHVHTTQLALAQLAGSPVSERDLIAGVIAGDRAAGRALYDAHAPRIYRLAYRIAGDEELARDCTQETFIRAFQRLGDFRGDAAFGTWIHRVAVTVTLNAMRRRKRWWSRETVLEAAEEVQAAPASSDPDLRERLTAAIDALPEIYRLVVVMHDVEEYTHLEIAGMLGIPVGTSKARLSAARAKLRKALAAYAEEWQA